ncbi:MAG: helix-turn-helix transcriptional regulator [Desulfitobacteriaceae bacterium]|nr:helix-turn-helix transcriptional regulator [Desulfitobacteriaceae bacterium]MDI6915336.1 helix-turn-helix transcriptional regulator [Desulfitobacteriaceae bacterium]
MHNIRKLVGYNIRNCRRAKGFTQERLAEMLGVSGAYIGYIERGSKGPSLELLAKIAASLTVEPAALLTSYNAKERELDQLTAVLSGKEVQQVRFIREVAQAYFRSLEK